MFRNADSTDGVPRRTVLRRGAAVAGALTLATGTASAADGRAGQTRFFSVQKPENAVAPDEPTDQARARGLSLLALADDEESVRWKLFLDDVENVTGVHVHRGAADETGPHLVELFNPPEPTDEVDGFLDRGEFGVGDACTDEDFPDPNDCITQAGQPAGPPEDVTFEDVLAEIRSGDTYVQVHTESGVLRGQIR